MFSSVTRHSISSSPSPVFLPLLINTLLWFDDISDQVKGLNENRDKVKTFKKPDSAGTGWMFLVVLEGMVYTVGAIFAAAALYLGTYATLLQTTLLIS